MTLKEIINNNDELASKVVTIIKRPSRLRYLRDDLSLLFRIYGVACSFSMKDLKEELYKVQGYKTQKR